MIQAPPNADQACLSAWIISEGSPGHMSQSQGLAAALDRINPLQIAQLECRQRGAGGWRPLVRLLFRCWPGQRAIWTRLSSRLERLPQHKPDMLIASGGKTIFPARYLADRYAVPLIYCGNPAPYPHSWFDCILATDAPPAGRSPASWIKTDVLINSVSPEKVAEAAGECQLPTSGLQNENGRLGAVLIGGRSRSQCFVRDDWLTFSRQLNRLAEEEGWRWLIATSRRTGRDVEELLRGSIKPESILDAAWWASQPRKVIRSFLGHADMVLVGRDSMTMVSEAVCSGRPVLVFGPDEQRPSQLIDNFMANLVDKGLAGEQSCANISAGLAVLQSLTPFSSSPVSDYAAQVWNMLGRTDKDCAYGFE